MKYVWESSKCKVKASYKLWGLYRKTGRFTRELICYFLSQNDAVESAEYLGTSFMACGVRRGL